MRRSGCGVVRSGRSSADRGVESAAEGMDHMKHRATLASAMVVVLLTGIVSAGAKTGILSVERSGSPAVVSLESADSLTGDGGQAEPGKPGKSSKGSKPKGSSAGSGGAGVDVSAGGSAPAGSGSIDT